MPNNDKAPSGETKEHRVFLNDREEGTFICPACDKGVIRDLSQFSQTRAAVRLKAPTRKEDHVNRIAGATAVAAEEFPVCGRDFVG